MTTTETQELASLIRDTVKEIDAGGLGVVSLDHYLFDRMPCSRRKVYAVAKKHAAEWGYEYHNACYKASGNRAFSRVMVDQMAHRSAPFLYTVRPV